jgi:hypothetical protein
MATPRGWTTSASLRSRSAAKTVWNGSVAITTDEAGGRLSTVNGGISFRPGARWQFSMLPTYVQQRDSQQYVTTENAGTAATYGRRYVFAVIDRHTLSTQFRLGYTFKPDLTLELYAEPFAASGRYADFGELLAPATRQRLLYGTGGTTVSTHEDGSRSITARGYTFTLANRDFNTSSFRSNLVLRWEWRPGSTLYLVWQQDRYQSDPIGAPVGAGDLFASLSSPGQNYFVLKTSFWLPVW